MLHFYTDSYKHMRLFKEKPTDLYWAVKLVANEVTQYNRNDCFYKQKAALLPRVDLEQLIVWP